MAYSRERGVYYDAAEARAYTLASKYALLPQDVEAMLFDQDERCAICGRFFKKTPHVDHDHTTGFVRGLLCSGCNTGLGMFSDNPRILAAAIVYLEQAKVRYEETR